MGVFYPRSQEELKLVEKYIGTKLDQLYSTPIKPDTVPKQEIYVQISFNHDSAK